MSRERIWLSVRAERDYIPEGGPTELLVLVRIEAGIPPASSARRLNIGLVVDRSGSMSGAKLEALRRAARRLVASLHPDDRISLTAYGDLVQTVVPSLPASQKEAILAGIDSLHAGGCTALHPGWLMGAVETGRHLAADRLNRVILISDGMANVGETNPRVLVEHARELAARGVSTTTLGIGDTFSEELLIPMAVEGGGNAWFAERAEDIESVLLRELGGMRSLVSERATLNFDTTQARVVDVYNELPRTPDGALVLPPIQGDSSLDIVIRVAAFPGAVNQEIVPMTVRLRASPVDGSAEVQIAERLVLHTVPRASAGSIAPNTDVQALAARLELARMHASCVKRIDAGDFAGAQQVADFALQRVRRYLEQQPDSELARDVRRVEQLRDRLSNREEQARHRKRLRFTAIYAQRGRNAETQ